MRRALAITLLLAAPLVAGADDLAAGKKLYTGKCARCHELYNPAKYDGEHWNRWMSKMSRKARLSDEQSDQLAAYLESLRSPATERK